MITQVDGGLIENHTITVEDVNTSEAGGALVTKVTNADGTISITSTGADAGTGEVSIKANLITDHKDLTALVLTIIPRSMQTYQQHKHTWQMMSFTLLINTIDIPRTYRTPYGRFHMG